MNKPRNASLTRPQRCDQPDDGGRCGNWPAQGFNPLGLCVAHLTRYRERIRTGTFGEARIRPQPVTDVGDYPTLVYVAGGVR